MYFYNYFFKANYNRATLIPTTFIPDNYTNNSSKKRSQILNYYKTVTPKAENTLPITLSWHIDAYVPPKRDGAFKRCCNKIKKIEEIEIPVKHILKNGKNFLLRNLFYF
jgi:hypothetical protein